MPEAGWARALAWLLWVCLLGPCSVGAQTPLHLTVADKLSYEAASTTLPPYEVRSASLPGTWQTVTLPHVMPRRLLPGAPDDAVARQRTIVAWFRLQVPALPVADSPRYLYIPRWKTDGQLAVYGDGRLLYQSHASVRWNGWNIPLWIALNETAGAATPREILLRIERPYDSGGGLSSVWLGEAQGLDWRFRVRDLLQVQLPYLGSAAFLAVGLFSLFIWFRLRQETVFLLFFLVSLASFFRTLHFHVGENRLPVSDEWFTWLTVNALYWMCFSVHFFLNVLHGRSRPWLNRLVAGVCLGVGLVSLPVFPGLPGVYEMSHLLYIVLLVIGTTVAVVGLRQSRRVGSRDGVLLGLWALVGMAFGAYDWLLQNNFIDVESIYLGPYSNIGAFLVFVYIIFGRYVAAHDAVRQANAHLALRLQAREAELGQSHQRLREIEHRQTLIDERQRLMQDMHDGMGSSLRTALLAVERGRMDHAMVAEVLKGCIDDLKLAIDSMEPVQADLLLLLATLRFRLGPRLDAAGVALRWQVENVPPLDWLDPRNALHILRILQEAFTNIIKHTQASEIRVATRVDGDQVVITITDNGQGFAVDPLALHAGRGMSNQSRRAQAIGGQIHWASSPAGTCLSLHLPITRPPAT
jgi:signal transduction histidine kinase